MGADHTGPGLRPVGLCPPTAWRVEALYPAGRPCVVNLLSPDNVELTEEAWDNVLATDLKGAWLGSTGGVHNGFRRSCRLGPLVGHDNTHAAMLGWMSLFNRPPMPSLDGATEWLNSESLSPAGLRGRVVLVDFWGVLRDGRLYQLVREHDEVRERTLEITFDEPGAEAHVFTFG